MWAIKAPGLSCYCLHCTLVSPEVPIGYSHSLGSSKADDRCLLHLVDTPGKCCGRPGAGQSKGKRDLGGSKGQVGRRGARPLSPWLVQVTPLAPAPCPSPLSPSSAVPLPASQREHQGWLGTCIVDFVESPPRLSQSLHTSNSLRYKPCTPPPPSSSPACHLTRSERTR